MTVIDDRPIRRRSRSRAVILSIVVGATALLPIAVAGSASAAPIVSCNSPVYNGTVSAKLRCDAATAAKIRIVAWCWIGPIPVEARYGPWVSVPAGQWRNATFTSNGWCSSPGQTWVANPGIA
jgi:hypothetical protein